MRRFVWRLQRVLDVRTKQEQIERVELMMLTEKLAKTRAELMMQKRILKNIISQITKKDAHQRLSEQELFLRCSQESDLRIKQLGNQVGQLESQQKEKIAEVIKLKKLTEGLEKLRAQTKKDFMYKEEQLEQKQLDEGAVVGFVRKSYK
ncbi:MAG: hypothetical protein KAS69_01625 [Planctomycetes bacterium]|nr:hypothetical protein [Planctomycetota bacterium]